MRRVEMKMTLGMTSVALLGVLLAGCSLKVDKEKTGESEKVEIQTPVGGLKVRTNIDAKDTGLSVYPNSRPVPKRHDDDDDSANVNISTPFFALKVLAMKFETDDSPDKVADFYRKDMNRYGKVVECRGTSGSSHGKGEGKDLKLTLDCDDEDPGSKNIELKAGQGNSQHIVGIKPKGKGSEFGLVYIQIHGSERETM